MSTFFISDLHFGHTNLILNKRGFSSVEEHDNHIIQQWNKVVNKRDLVYILGDVTMERKNPYILLHCLNGIKNVVLGNHDRPQDVKSLLQYVNSVSGTVKYKEFWLSHFPIHESELRGRCNISGHDHNAALWNISKDYRYFNVSCESLNYTPISIENIRRIINQRKFNQRLIIL